MYERLGKERKNAAAAGDSLGCPGEAAREACFEGGERATGATSAAGAGDVKSSRPLSPPKGSVGGLALQAEAEAEDCTLARKSRSVFASRAPSPGPESEECV
jgi:hypothetical protein